MAKKNDFIVEGKGNKKLFKLFEREHEKQLRKLVVNGLRNVIARIEELSHDSVIDYRDISLIEYDTFFAIVLPKQKRKLDKGEHKRTLIDFKPTSGSDGLVAKLCPLPPLAIPKEVRARSMLIARRVTEEEYDFITESLLERVPEFLLAGLVEKGTIGEVKRLIYRNDGYDDIEVTDNLSWIMLREEFGRGEKQVMIWRKSITEFEKYIQKHTKEIFNDIVLRSEGIERVSGIDEMDGEFFTKGISGNVREPGVK